MCILGFVMLPHAAPYSWLQLPQRQTAQKTKNKKQEKQEPTQNHYPFSVSLLFHRYFYISLSGTAKNHPESPGKNHVTYPRKAVPVITGYGLSTSLIKSVRVLRRPRRYAQNHLYSNRFNAAGCCLCAHELEAIASTAAEFVATLFLSFL